MSEAKTVGSVSYATRDEAYFEGRQLKRVAGPWKLWAMGVAAVISGAFSGWNFGLGVGGFWGLAIATLLITAMYLLLCLSLAEMGTALPHTGGAYSFARTSMGPWGGFVTGLAENMEYVFTPAVIAFFAGSYLKAVFAGTPLGALPDPLWWALLYVVFITLNVLGAHLSFRFAFVITLVAMGVLLLFFGAALPHVDFAKNLFDIPPAPGGTPALPFGLGGILMALPFAVWFYLGIEELPLASEETNHPERDLPRGIIGGILTLIVITLFTLVLNTGLAPGAAKLSTSGEPILDGFRTLFGDGSARLLGLAATAGLVASFHGIMYAYGRQIYSLSRAGYFPTFLSLTHPKHKTPWVALVGGGVVGYAVMLALWFFSADATVYIGTKLLCMAVFGAMISYVLQMASFVILRLRFPGLARPFVSKLGVPGAVVAGAIALVTLVTLFVVDPVNYRSAAIGACAWFAGGILYFALHSRKRLVLSPEEAFALRASGSGGAVPEGVPAAHEPDAA
ncbi:MAG: ethanolamine permease [Anaeromyxobacter sp.]